MRPEYQFVPGDSITSEIEAAQVPLTQPPEPDDSIFSDDNQSQDINAPLSNEPQQMSDDSPQRAAILQQNLSTAADPIQEDNPRHGQTTPGDHDTRDQYHEL